MSTRCFRDTSGVTWHVWKTVPGPLGRLPGFASWLIFESGTARRRLSPIPNGWETVASQRLEQMCRVAQPVDQRDVLTDLVDAGQLLITSIATPAPSAKPLENVAVGDASEFSGTAAGPGAAAASRAYQPPPRHSRTNYRA